MLRELQNIILLRDWRKPTGGAEWSVGILGGVIALIGIILALGGAKLISVGGSWYYLIAGLALIVAGLAVAQRKLLGAWIYAGAFVITALWAFWEVGLNGWALVPRLVGPLVLLLLVILSFPVLDANRGRRQRLFGLGGFVVIVIVLGVAVAQANRPDAPGAMPEPFAQAMADASLMQVGADWPAYGGTYNAQRYSPLDQINRENVGRLERAWTFRTGDMPKERWGAETTPLKIGDTLYLCTGRSTLIAIEAATGAERWRHDPEVSDASIPYTAACRGVAYYAASNADPAGACATRIIAGTLDARLIAVDAHTGTPCADFGKNGAVDITIGMGETGPGMVSITSAPTIVRGVVITGQQVLDGQRANAPSGVVQGFDAITGALRWAWDMEHPERTGRPPEGKTYARGTPNMWTTATGDEGLGLVYLPLGNAAADYWSSHRSQAENEHSAALVALNVETGREVWRFQTVHMGVWDYDLGSQPTLIDFPTGAGVVPAVILPTKQGEIYILDRRTGVPLHGVEERPVPGGGLEPELRSPTQPFSRYHTLRMPDLRERDMWGMSLIDQMICRIQFRQATYHGIYTPPTTTPAGACRPRVSSANSPPMAAYAPSICARGEPFGIARSARRVALAPGAFLPCCRSISARQTMAARSSPRADSSSSPRRPTISSAPSTSKPARRCGRIFCRPAARLIRWYMRSAAGSISSSWLAGITSWGPPPEITSSLTRCRNARGAPNPREQHHQHAGQDRHGQAQPSAANNVEPGDCKEPGDAAEYDGDRGNIELALELW